MVLLQNNGPLLPLEPHKRRIAVVGPFTKERATLLGSWAPDGIIEDTTTLLDALRAAAPQAIINDVSSSLTDEMLMEVAQSEIVILAVGESNMRNGEYNSVASLNLPAGQEELIAATHALGKPIVLVVLAGRPLALGRVGPLVDAILFAWHPGSAGAAAIADVIFGNAVPGGKLPVSFPRTEGQVPIHYNHNSTGKPFARYLDLPVTPLYPFGFGLSYITFAYSDFQINRQTLTLSAVLEANATVQVSVVVTNTGQRAADEVVQCYVQDRVASITRPVRELKGFQRITLQPDESRTVAFSLGKRELGFYGRDGQFRVEPGAFQVWLGSDSGATLGTEFRVL
jgi:beta-glucosidase